MPGFQFTLYAEPLVEFGVPRHLLKSDGWILKRQIAGTKLHDAMECYPIFSCRDWALLPEDLTSLGDDLVILAHERPEGMDDATVIMCGLKHERVLEAVATVVEHAASAKRPFRMVPEYEADNISKTVVRIMMSYTDYVNRTVWRHP